MQDSEQMMESPNISLCPDWEINLLTVKHPHALSSHQMDSKGKTINAFSSVTSILSPVIIGNVIRYLVYKVKKL